MLWRKQAKSTCASAEPGDLILIPHGWHHAIVNLETSCAVAHTAVMPSVLPRVWPQFYRRQPAFAHVLQDILAHERPAVAASLAPIHPSALMLDEHGGKSASAEALPPTVQRGASSSPDSVPVRALPRTH